MKIKEVRKNIWGLDVIELRVVGYRKRPVYSEEMC